MSETLVYRDGHTQGESIIALNFISQYQLMFFFFFFFKDGDLGVIDCQQHYLSLLLFSSKKEVLHILALNTSIVIK